MPVSLRLSLFYGAVFLVVGVQTPFWPVWLAARGLDAGEIGVLLAAPHWVKLAANPLAGWAADRTDRNRVMTVLAVGACLGFALFLAPGGFWSYLLLSIVTGACFSALMPLGDNLALAQVYARGLDYGRLRLWGSITFIAAALLGGRFLAAAPADAILYLLLAATALTFVTVTLLPRGARRPIAARSSPFALLGDRRYLLLIAGTSLIQASHSLFYAFGTLHWQALGYSGDVIGMLWAGGVVAEIGLFAMSGALTRRVSPASLLAIAGLAGLARWTIAAFAVALPWLAAAQLLHALTFGAAHLGAMHFLARNVPAELSASGQSLYSALSSGIGFGVAMLATGALYDAFGGRAYLAMAAMAASGTAAALLLAASTRSARQAGTSAVSIDS
jgi:PPP family 3-phenylpropionic acid transporter